MKRKVYPIDIKICHHQNLYIQIKIKIALQDLFNVYLTQFLTLNFILNYKNIKYGYFQKPGRSSENLEEIFQKLVATLNTSENF